MLVPSTSEPSKSEKQTLVANSYHLLDILQGLAILDLVARKHGWILVSHDTVKGVACKATGWNPGECYLHSVSGCTIDTKRCQKCHLIVLAFLQYK